MNELVFQRYDDVDSLLYIDIQSGAFRVVEIDSLDFSSIKKNGIAAVLGDSPIALVVIDGVLGFKYQQGYEELKPNTYSCLNFIVSRNERKFTLIVNGNEIFNLTYDRTIIGSMEFGMDDEEDNDFLLYIYDLLNDSDKVKNFVGYFG
ncbi:hypothetical protein [Marinobacterium stanieri]|uniref:Uncharacterized protein n=1 Tax=Marinobacterium stanieri TaxID=49186 RepID=A0A1N6S6I6_9GAMM|nr:hypothetical protein [Marinobacterium stanieri]SIQ36650.1 hypothetical protein SAMN05421647_10455 [Marinobacterium stanieri]